MSLAYTPKDENRRPNQSCGEMSRFCDFVSSSSARSSTAVVELPSIRGFVLHTFAVPFLASARRLLCRLRSHPLLIALATTGVCRSAKAKQLNKSKFRHINDAIIIRFRNAYNSLTYTNSTNHAHYYSVQNSTFGRPLSFHFRTTKIP